MDTMTHGIELVKAATDFEFDPDRIGDTADDGDPSTWASWTDDDVWQVDPEGDGPPAEDLDASGRLTLSQLVNHQRGVFAGWDTEAGDLLAAFMGELADRIEATGARTPAEYFARIDIIDREARDATYRSGFLAGLTSARSCQPAGVAFGHEP